MIMGPGTEVECIDDKSSKTDGKINILDAGHIYVVERVLGGSLGCARCGSWVGDCLITLVGIPSDGLCSGRFRPRRRWIEELQNGRTVESPKEPA